MIYLPEWNEMKLYWIKSGYSVYTREIIVCQKLQVFFGGGGGLQSNGFSFDSFHSASNACVDLGKSGGRIGPDPWGNLY